MKRTNPDDVAISLVQSIGVQVGLAVPCNDVCGPKLRYLAWDWSRIACERVEWRKAVYNRKGQNKRVVGEEYQRGGYTEGGNLLSRDEGNHGWDDNQERKYGERLGGLISFEDKIG